MVHGHKVFSDDKVNFCKAITRNLHSLTLRQSCACLCVKDMQTSPTLSSLHCKLYLANVRCGEAELQPRPKTKKGCSRSASTVTCNNIYFLQFYSSCREDKRSFRFMTSTCPRYLQNVRVVCPQIRDILLTSLSPFGVDVIYGSPKSMLVSKVWPRTFILCFPTAKLIVPEPVSRLGSI